MKLPSVAIAWSAGIAIFSMFFGAGNVVFPLILGQLVGDQIFWALLGLAITAVGAPLLGLLGSVLFNGDCKQFFYRIGPLPGYFIVVLIMAILGPFGVMPRCFIVAYGAIKSYFPSLSLFVFSQIAGVVSLLLIARRNLILPVLGLFLSPLLIITLVIVILVGIFKMGGLPPTGYTPISGFYEGLLVGYDTMDLLASIFFAVSIWMLLKEKLNLHVESQVKAKLVPTYVASSLIGGGLLGLIYVGLSFSAALHPEAFVNVAPEQVLASLAVYLLGPKLSIVANIAVALACLTTVMSLAVAIVDVIHVELKNSTIAAKIPYSYGWMMFITILITIVFTNLGFSGIMMFLHPILELVYPAIVVLTIVNILYKLWGFRYIKLPFYGTLLATILWKLAPISL